MDFGILEDFFLSIARWVFTLPACEPILRELDSFPSWLMDRKLIHIIGSKLSCFSFRLKFHTSRVLIYFPFLSFLFLHFPLLLSWWHTCWSGACAFLSILDAKYWVYYVCICTHISICFLFRNIKNICVKSLHSNAFELLVLMKMVARLEEFISDLYEIFSLIWMI